MTADMEKTPQLRVLVTAGAGGIGRVIAESFAQKGARLHICDIADAALDEAKKTHPTWGVSHCDVSQPDQVARLFEEVGAKLGGLDVLINNAGIAGPTGGVEEIAADDWRRTVDIDLNGQFYCANRAVPMLKKSQNALLLSLGQAASALMHCCPVLLRVPALKRLSLIALRHCGSLTMIWNRNTSIKYRCGGW